MKATTSQLSEQDRSDSRRRNWDRYVRRRFGITVDRFEELYQTQDGRCAACMRLATARGLLVDVCRVTARVRGLLCRTCLRALALLQGDARSVEGLLRYARKDASVSQSIGRFPIPRQRGWDTSPEGMEKRIWKKIQKEKSGHWLWIGNVNFQVEWMGNVVNAVRFLWRKEGRPLVDDERLHRHCDVESCVNPEHFRIKKAAPEPERPKREKIDPGEHEAIKKAVELGTTTVALAKQYGVSRVTISRIVNDKIGGR